MDNVIVDKPERLDQDIEDFKIDAVEDEKNFTVARLRVCRDPEKETPVIFYTQELNRNFKDPTDPMGKRYLIKSFTPSNAMASIDTSLERKFGDTMLAHKPRIRDYSPLTDIHSSTMNLFLDDESATYLSDIGVNIDGLGEDFQSMESVEATPYMEDVSMGVEQLKAELRQHRLELRQVKLQMADEIDGFVDVDADDDEFNKVIAMHRVSDHLVQQYLAGVEKIHELKTQLGQATDAVFSETKVRIRLPPRLNIDDVIGL